MSQQTEIKGFSTNDIEQNKVFAGMGYIIFFIPLLIKDSKFAKFHANQILLILIPSIIINMVFGIIMAILLGGLHVALAGVVSFIIGIINLIIGIVAIINMINAFQGKARRIPILGKMTILKGSNDIDVDDMIQNDKLDKLSESFQNISFGSGSICSSCGAQVGKGKKFCSKCGTKVEEMKKCVNCGAEIELGKKFCPDCGGSLPDEKRSEQSQPLECINCGAEIPEGKKFCSDCGTPILEIQKSKLNIPIQCSNCGSEIPKGKKFCPDCGTKVNEE